MHKILLQKLLLTLEQEKTSLVLWLCAFYFFGILFFFSLERDITRSILLTLSTITVLSIYYVLYCKNISRILALLIISFNAGIGVSFFKQQISASYGIHKRIQKAYIEGTIYKIKPTPFGNQIYLKDLYLEPLEGELPVNLRLLAPKYSTLLILTGDRISTLASISPPPAQIVPGGYNFETFAYFNKIGSIASSKSDIEIISYSEKNTVSSYISNLRKMIFSILIKNLGNQNGNIAAALFLGETGGINKKILQDMRFAGISHILCVSGLHLSLVASIFFLSFRFILNLSNYIAYRYDVKKLSAYFSLLGAFIYLLLTGMQTAAIRAFIMVSVLLYSIIISRQPFPMRSLILAAFIILTINPEYSITPSFQLSFTAVLSLLIGFSHYVSYMKKDDKSSGIVANIKLYVYSNVYSSIIASIATAPIVIYHFFIHSNYSVLGNLLVLPIVGFIIMPVAIISLPFQFTFLSKYFFFIIGYFIGLLVEISDKIASLPYSVIYVGGISAYGAFIYILGIFCLGFFSTRLKYSGIIFIMISAIVSASYTKPDILINNDSKFIAVNTKTETKIYGAKISKFTLQYVANWYGKEKAQHIKADLFDKPLELSKQIIIFKKEGVEVNNKHYDDQMLEIFLNKDGASAVDTFNNKRFKLL